jgi:hypothetical protein|tara:strand:+ start:1960 stop:2229 length:270 start_codon:yes stop_codon:yes gene_type:complete
MLYPNLPDYTDLKVDDLQRFYRELLVYTDELKFLLESRDIELDRRPTSNILTVVTVASIGRPSNGNVVFAASASKFRGFVSGTGWVDFN